MAYRTPSLICRTFSSAIPILVKRKLYISFVKSLFQYCLVIWKHYLITDIKLLESIQRRATKYILNNYTSDYKDCLLELNILPLAMQFELNDVLFYFKAIKSPYLSFDIIQYLITSEVNTRSGRTKLQVYTASSSFKHSFFNRFPLNALPIIDSSLSMITIKNKLRSYLFSHFMNNFESNNICTFHFLYPCHKCSISPPTPNFQTL